MTTARREQVDLSVTPYYHCMARCVRRAYLCGRDSLTGRDFSHRKGWIRERIRHLASVFAIDICAYAVMSNHLHVVLHADKDRALGWTEDEVIERHTTLYPLSKVKVEGQLPKGDREKLVATWRARLHDISWFMRGLNEFIARMANKEDKVGGRFWEGRFKSQALVDERGVLAAMAYVDLNPLRAGLANGLEDSDFTSIQERLADQVKKRSQRKELSAPKGMASFFGQAAESGRSQGILPIAFKDYVQLVEWTADIVSGTKNYDRDRVPTSALADGSEGTGWLAAQSGHAIATATVLGSPNAVRDLAEKRGKRSVRGVSVARHLAG